MREPAWWRTGMEALPAREWTRHPAAVAAPTPDRSLAGPLRERLRLLPARGAEMRSAPGCGAAAVGVALREGRLRVETRRVRPGSLLPTRSVVDGSAPTRSRRCARLPVRPSPRRCGPACRRT